MRRTYDDPFARKPRTEPAVRRDQPLAALAIILLTLVSVLLLLLSRFDHALIRQARLLAAEALAPALGVLSAPFAPLRRAGQSVASLAAGSDEIERLSAENKRLKMWEARAGELQRRLADLEALARVVPSLPTEFVTARVIAEASGPFARSVLVDAGRDNRLREGYPVVNADGLVGRVIETGSGAARVLLLTDLNSRIPVLAGNAGASAILTGDNGPRPKLAHISAGAVLGDGDLVVTSGIGGFFGRGQRIGTLRRASDGWRVELGSRLDALDHVSVLLLEMPATDSRSDELPSAPEQSAARTAIGHGAPAAAGEPR